MVRHYDLLLGLFHHLRLLLEVFKELADLLYSFLGNFGSYRELLKICGLEHVKTLIARNLEKGFIVLVTLPPIWEK